MYVTRMIALFKTIKRELRVACDTRLSTAQRKPGLDLRKAIPGGNKDPAAVVPASCAAT